MSAFHPKLPLALREDMAPCWFLKATIATSRNRRGAAIMPDVYRAMEMMRPLTNVRSDSRLSAGQPNARADIGDKIERYQAG